MVNHLLPGEHFNIGLIACLLLGLCLIPAESFIPHECIYNITQPGKVCCPPDPKTGQVCGGPRRGVCRRVVVVKETEIPEVFQHDDRLFWPTRFVNYACECQRNFWGIDCSECWFGWTGPNCDVPVQLVRRDIRTLSDRDLFIFKDVVRLSQTWPSRFAVLKETNTTKSDPLTDPEFETASVQYVITNIHAYNSRTTIFTDEDKCDEYGILNFCHDGPSFITWHRYFIMIWERWLGEIALEVHKVRNFALPYWDWVGMRECDVCNNKFVGGKGETEDGRRRISRNSVFYNNTEYCWEAEPEKACSGCQKWAGSGKITRELTSKDFPDQDDIDFLMNLNDYFVVGERDHPDCVSFHMALEGFCGLDRRNHSMLWAHNRVHMMFAGSMSSTMTATNDPIFMLHHSFVDKLFAVWFRLHNPQPIDFPNHDVRPGHARNSYMTSILPLVRNVVMLADTQKLGYDYDNMKLALWAQNGRGVLKYLD